jgi:hypothetical protein
MLGGVAGPATDGGPDSIASPKGRTGGTGAAIQIPHRKVAGDSSVSGSANIDRVTFEALIWLTDTSVRAAPGLSASVNSVEKLAVVRSVKLDPLLWSVEYPPTPVIAFRVQVVIEAMSEQLQVAFVPLVKFSVARCVNGAPFTWTVP